MILSHALRARKKAISIALAFRSSATSTGSTIVAPSDIVAGDLLVMYDNVSASSIPTTVVPAGFTSILNNTVGTIRRCICSYKIATGSEAGTTITGLSGTGGALAKILHVYSTNGATTGTVRSINYEQTDADPAAQTITSGSGVAPLVAINFIRNTSPTPTNTMTPTQDGNVQNGGHYSYYKIYNSSPANVTVDTNDGGLVNMLMSFYIEAS
jgi:hypothetical protein